MTAYTNTGPATGTAAVAREHPLLDRFFLPSADAPSIDSPDAAAKILAPLFFGLDREACYVAHLTTKYTLIGTEMVSLGSVDHTFMDPRGVFRGAMLANASAVIVAHNHPSGNPEPSRDDELVTKRLARAGEILGVEVIDALVFGGERWVSLARRGLV